MSVEIRPLEYSEEVLNKRLEYIEVINIQGVKRLKINLPPNGIVRLNASSEVGKSAILKPLEALSTSNYNSKKEIESLVNEDSATGQVIVKLINNTYIGLNLDKTNTNNCYYMVQYPDGSRERLNYPNDIEKVLKILGWYTTGTKKLDFSLNVRLRGLLPIIETEKRLNSEIFNAALNDETLDNTYFKVKDKISECEAVLNRTQEVYSNLDYAISTMVVEDEEELEAELYTYKLLLERDTTLSTLSQVISDLYSVTTTKPLVVKSPKNVPEFLENLKILNSLDVIIGDLPIKSKPIKQLLNVKLPNYLNKLNCLNKLEYNTKSMYVEKPERRYLNKQILNEIEYMSKLSNVSSPLTDILNINKPTVINYKLHDIDDDLRKLELYGKILTIIPELFNIETLKASKLDLYKLKLSQLETLCGNIIDCKSNLNELKNNLKTIRYEKSKYQCPTCGQYYIEGHLHQ